MLTQRERKGTFWQAIKCVMAAIIANDRLLISAGECNSNSLEKEWMRLEMREDVCATAQQGEHVQ